MRWPFGPPHLTLKPPKKTNKKKTKKQQKNNKKTKNKKKQKQIKKEGLGPSEVALRATSHDP